MHTFTRARRSAALLTGAALAAVLAGTAAPGPAGAAPAPNGSVTSDTAKGMVYTGGNAANHVTVTMTGTAFLVSDTAPITIDAGCSSVPMGGGLFGAICLAPKEANGQLKRFTVHGGNGDDVLTNSSAAGMHATGAAGKDVLNGGNLADRLTDNHDGGTLRGNGGDDVLETDFSGDDGVPDVLDGGPGDDDLRAGPTDDTILGGPGDDTARGGMGADHIDLGTGANDTMVYLENGRPDTRNVVSLDGNANDGQNIGTSEKDNVMPSVEAVFGGHGPDLLIGGAGPNHLDGNEGDDILIGKAGADHLRGRGGNDQLYSNDFLDIDVPDGAVDTLEGGPGIDYCLIGLGEGDLTNSCETIEQST